LNQYQTDDNPTSGEYLHIFKTIFIKVLITMLLFTINNFY